MISITLPNVEQLLERVNEIEKKRIPYAISRALNLTAMGFRGAMRTGISRRFVVRVPRFILGSEKGMRSGLVHVAKGEESSYKRGQYSATVAVGGSEPSSKSFGSRFILNKFEPGGERTSDDPNNPIAIPTKALRPSFSDKVPRAMYPKNLGHVGSRGHEFGELPTASGHNERSKKRPAKRARGTFVIGQMGEKQWGIYRRVGPGKNDIQKIWSFRTRIPIPRRLQFYETAQAYVPNSWRKHMRQALGEALDRSGGTARADSLLE
ncbi:MAG: hypothetical protein ACSLFE_03790 [Gemmatimonadaceae bacterium]